MEREAGVDETVHWHGDYREWTPDGGLAAHYRYQHGVLRVILTESGAALEKRLAAKIPLVPRDGPAVPKAAVVPAEGTAALPRASEPRPAPTRRPEPVRKPVPPVKKPTLRSKPGG